LQQLRRTPAQRAPAVGFSAQAASAAADRLPARARSLASLAVADAIASICHQGSYMARADLSPHFSTKLFPRGSIQRAESAAGSLRSRLIGDGYDSQLGAFASGNARLAAGIKEKRPVGARPLVAWGFRKEVCKTRLAAAAEPAGSGTSPIRAGYREVRPTAHHVEHGYSLPVLPFPVHGPAVPSRRYFRT
jgi:hypothetical protein